MTIDATDPHAFIDLIDLASERLGGEALLWSDEFFAPAENLVKPERPVFVADRYTERGKWMDGWESRRKRVPGHDWCILALGLPGVIRGIDVDTAHFLGNYPEHASLDAATFPGDPDDEELLDEGAWTRLVPISELAGGSHNFFEVADARCWTHVRLNIYPDGGVARLRVHGEVVPDREALYGQSIPVDLAAVEHGGLVVLANDMFFSHRSNLIMPGRGANMGDGWETRRKRGPGNDWAIVKLGVPGVIKRAEVDTLHFKGNFPESCSLEGCFLPGSGVSPALFREADRVPPSYLAGRSVPWVELLPRTKLSAHHLHVFEEDLHLTEPLTHVRLSIYPDGGVSRLRLFGFPIEARSGA